MLFKDVIGQEEAKQRLIAEVKEGRIPHAQLICGSSPKINGGSYRRASSSALRSS